MLLYAQFLLFTNQKLDLISFQGILSTLLLSSKTRPYIPNEISKKIYEFFHLPSGVGWLRFTI